MGEKGMYDSQTERETIVNSKYMECRLFGRYGIRVKRKRGNAYVCLVYGLWAMSKKQNNNNKNTFHPRIMLKLDAEVALNIGHCTAKTWIEKRGKEMEIGPHPWERKKLKLRMKKQVININVLVGYSHFAFHTPDTRQHIRLYALRPSTSTRSITQSSEYLQFA